MYWLTKPPLLRYLAAALLVAMGLFLELRPEPTVPHPFAMSNIRPGQAVSEEDVEFREVRADLLPPVSLPGVAVIGIEAGEPVTRSALTTTEGVAPEGWWSLEIPVPQGAAPGMEVLLVAAGAQGVGGKILSLAPGDDYGGGIKGLVAVPPEAAAILATAAEEGRLAVLLGP